MNKRTQTLKRTLSTFPGDDSIRTEHRDQLEQQLLANMAWQEPKAELGGLDFWRLIQTPLIFRWARYAIAAAMVAVLAIAFLRPTSHAYALGQTVQALKQVRFLHVTLPPTPGGLSDDRWIELGPEGQQIRYRQETFNSEVSHLIVDDGKSCMDYDRNAQTVSIKPSDGRVYEWIGNLQDFFKQMADDRNVILDEVSEQNGRSLQHVVWPKLHLDCYVDILSKLPTKVGPYLVSYEAPPAGAFEWSMPANAKLLENQPDDKQVAFEQARSLLARGQWSAARQILEAVVQAEPQMNWAWFWLGRSSEELGDSAAAVENYTRVIDLLKTMNNTPHYCHLARALALRKLGQNQAAQADLEIALPVMISSLERIEGTAQFDYADDFGRKADLDVETRFGRMIKRLELATGTQLGNGAETEAERAMMAKAWQKWWLEHATNFATSAPRQ